MIAPEDSRQFRDGFPTVNPEADSRCENYDICARAYNTLRTIKEVLESSVLATRVQLWGIDLARKCNSEDCPKRKILESDNRSAGLLINKILDGEV